jgi:hypothetical protein
MRTKTGDHRMSDTDRPGASSPAGGAKSTPRRGRAASRVASGRPAEDASSAPRQPEATAPDSAGDPGGSDASAIAAGAPEREIAPVSPSGPDRASRDALSDGVATPIGHEEATPSPEAAPPPEPDAPSPPAEEIAPSPWRHIGNEAPPPPAPASGTRTTARPLALAALLLSLVLPGALFAYLAASGVFDRVPERLAQVESAVEALRATAAAKPEVTRADVDKLAARLDALEKGITAQGQRPPSSASLDALSGKIEAASRDAKDALSVARSAADSANGAQSAAARLANVESKLVGLEKELATLEQAVTARPKQDANAPSILVMARAIEADLNRGVPYAGELDALSRLGADPKLVEALRPFAEKGAPSPASLAGDFESELEAAREKVAETTRPANWWDRVLGYLAQIVRVRHIGADEAGSPAGTVEQALARSDIAAARDAWEALPVFEKGATPHAGGRIKGLAEAYAASRKISTAALDAIRRSSTTDNGG